MLSWPLSRLAIIMAIHVPYSGNRFAVIPFPKTSQLKKSSAAYRFFYLFFPCTTNHIAYLYHLVMCRNTSFCMKRRVENLIMFLMLFLVLAFLGHH